MRPFGYFVHHQGRGHAERCRAILHALAPDRPVTVFCARDDIFGTLPESATIRRIASLFEADGPTPPGLADAATPDTLHCAPLGWPGVRRTMAMVVGWFDAADPELMIVDVSAEIAQLARICSVPHVKILQHGDRDDPGHRAAYDGAVGLLAPFDACLAQPGWDAAMLARTHFAPGLGLPGPMPGRAAARARLGLTADDRMVLAVSGGGGDGMALAPLAVGARTMPDARWVVIGDVRRDWHATVPGNLDLLGWVDDAAFRIAAADLVVTSAGNTLCAQVLAAGVPWIVVPEWRYFDEQHRKAEALDRAGLAHALPHLPASAQGWRGAADTARARHDPAAQRAAVRPGAAADTARWLEELARRCWRQDARAAPRPMAAE